MAVDKKRALTDKAYVNSLTPEELSELEGMLTEEELEQVSGGQKCNGTAGSCLASKRSASMCGGHC